MSHSHITADDVRDAVAWLRANATGDVEGRNTIAIHCNPRCLVDMITALHLRLLAAAYEDPDKHLTYLREHAEDIAASIHYTRNDEDWL